jgi:hypothetical protein
MPMRIGILAVALSFSFGAVGCGGAQVSAAPATAAADPWPGRSKSADDTATVSEALAGASGAHVRVRGYLVAVTLPCPACNVGTNRPPREDIAGRTSRPRGPAPPGCLPCPDPAATIGDDPPGAPSPRPSLRAVGVALALQPRHVGGMFVLDGVLHTTGPDGPELDVKDLRAIDGP